jgi:manganese/iron transport system permease protein/iron/zinc/copper transport system permease protein
MSELARLLLEPFRFDFFRNGLIAATMVGALCGLLGVYIVLRRMSYIGHGLSHAAFGGAVASYVLGLNFYVGAGLWAFLSAILINWTARRRVIGADAAIGIVTTASFAIGVALISKARRFTRNFEAALFGNILGVTAADLWIIAAVGLVVAVALFLAYKQLLFVTFDPEVAPSYGVPAGWIDAGFALALAATIVVSMNIVGVTLIAAAIVIPPIIARLLGNSFARMLGLSTLIGAACGACGMYLSFHVDVASGATIVLLGAALFLAVLASGALRRGRLERRPALTLLPRPGQLRRSDPAAHVVANDPGPRAALTETHARTQEAPR